ncbi:MULTISPECIES: hypothetical protein [Hyphomicrobiales]|uniref:hypothetical protein n=1 Tax=Hyphomicrobiales TaxID=356 RepID=UPI000F677A71|nr:MULTISPECIES: hypothetical protein [Hyphomicrobiales]MCQ9147367.1 hypothetical protein [Ochrobactrum sp. BTU2]MDH1270315.1 hypothetical protein [Agrobacterium pusense]MDX4076636.1 hypothetical protein [Brucella sp. NBRC 113783]RSC24740.1 hypothetical protein EGT36_28335 [Agrobacterium sp. FDAARGOS_525]
MRFSAAIALLALALAGCQTTGQTSTDSFVKKTLEENRTTLSVPKVAPPSEEYPPAPADTANS